MTRPAADLLQAVASDRVLEAGRPVVVMYSGGRDSTCLLDLAVRIAGAPAVRALHLNYGLRAAAIEDERHCGRLCDQLGVALEVRRVGAGEPPAGNIQAWARDRATPPRRSWPTCTAPTWRPGTPPPTRWRRSSIGLRPRPAGGRCSACARRDGRLIRPLLGFTRAQTADHCRARGLSWREDESNDSDLYARSRIRHGLVPALEAAHPAAQANVLALAEILRQEAAVLDELVDAELSGRREITLERLRQLPPALRRLVVQRLADDAAGGPAAGVARRADEVAAMSDRGRSALDLPSGVRATAQDGILRFGPDTPHASSYTSTS